MGVPLDSDFNDIKFSTSVAFFVEFWNVKVKFGPPDYMFCSFYLDNSFYFDTKDSKGDLLDGARD